MKTMIRNIVLVVGFLSMVGTASAQKFAHVSTDSLVSELSTKDSIQAKYMLKESVYSSEIQKMSDEFQRLQADFEKAKRDKTLSPAILSLKEKNLNNYYNTIQEFNQDASAELQEYQGELLEPIYKKVREAIEAVAKDKSYTYVIDNQSLLVSPQADDITDLVRKKLGL